MLHAFSMVNFARMSLFHIVNANGAIVARRNDFFEHNHLNNTVNETVTIEIVQISNTWV